MYIGQPEAQKAKGKIFIGYYLRNFKLKRKKPQ